MKPLNFLPTKWFKLPSHRSKSERNISKKDIMQSSLSFPHARRGLNFAPKPNPTTTHPPFPKSPLLFFSNPTDSSSSSHQLRLTSLSQPHPPRNEPLFTTPTESISTRRRTRLVSFVAPLHSRIPLNGKSHGSRSFRGWIEVVGEALSTAFPVWVALGCLLGLIRPSSFNWVQPKWTVLGITVTMLGMGMTLTFDDLCKALAMPKELLAGFVLQYTVCSSLPFSFSLSFVYFVKTIAGDAIVGICCQQALEVALLLCSWPNTGWLLPLRYNTYLFTSLFYSSLNSILSFVYYLFSFMECRNFK